MKKILKTIEITIVTVTLILLLSSAILLIKTNMAINRCDQQLIQINQMLESEGNNENK